jgi:hypothetical protein
MTHYRTTTDILRDIADLETDQERVAALRKAPRWTRDLLRFAFSENIEIDLPKHRLRVDEIQPSAFVETRRMERVSVETSCGDALAIESAKLERLFAKGAHATLTSKRRLELWTDILERADEEERSILESIRLYRDLPADLSSITPELVRSAHPGLLERPVTPVPLAEPYAMTPGILSPTPGDIDPSAISVRPVPAPTRVVDDAGAIHSPEYDRAMSMIRWG